MSQPQPQPQQLQPQPQPPPAVSTETDTAYQRTLLAEQRTFSAWVRTALAAVAAGFAIAKLAAGNEPVWMVRLLGALFILAGAAMLGIGYGAHQQALRELRPHGARSTPTWILAALSLAMLVGAGLALWLVVAY